MKQTLVIFSILLFTFTACKESDDTFKPSSIVSCQINGVEWKTDNRFTRASRYNGDGGPNTAYIVDDDLIRIFAMRTIGNDTSVIIIEFKKRTEMIGEYPLSFEENSEGYAVLYPNLEAAYWENLEMYIESPSSGTLKITAFNPKTLAMDAEFSFELKPNAANQSLPSYTVTEGKIQNLKRYPNY